MKKVPFYNWKGVSVSDTITSEATPPAKVEFLRTADDIVTAVACTYAQAGLMFQGNDAVSVPAMTTRRACFMIPPGSAQGQAWITRSGASGSGNLPQTDSTLQTTTSGGIPSAAADVITVPSQATGVECYLGTGTLTSLGLTFQSGANPDATPAATKNRLVELNPLLVSAVEVVEVAYCAGLSLVVAATTENLETL